MVRVVVPNPVPEPEPVRKLHKLAENSQWVLFRTQSVFPFSLFPTKVIVDVIKVTIIGGGPTGDAQTHSVYVADITDVSVTYSMFFASLELHIGFTPQIIKIPTLKKADAQKARRVIQGLIIAVKQQIDLSKFDNLADLANHIDALGSPETI